MEPDRPDFLCIGAQKAGTTWLHRNLAQHPEIWLPTVKEVHYFDYSLLHPSPLSRKYYNDRWRRQISQRLKGRWQERDLAGLSWDWNYFFRRRDDTWYGRVFEPGRGKCRGDVTPAYSFLEPELVARIARLLPEARVLFLMRDPIERAWSSARMSSDRRGMNLADEARWKRHFDAQRHKRGDYLRTLRNWRAHYPPERFFVGFFEDIVGKPAELLRSLWTFLGVRDDPRLLPASLGQRFNPSSKVEMPPEVEAYLARLYVDDLRELAEEFGDPASAWLERAERAARGATHAR